MSFFVMFVCSLVQSITEFLPVSSFGHIILILQLWGLEEVNGIRFAVMLHAGTALAVLVTFRKDFLHILSETLGLTVDGISNLYLYHHNRKSKEADIPYRRFITGTWRRLTLLIWISFLPTCLIGYLGRNLVPLSVSSPLLPGCFTLISGIFLLVLDLGQVGESKAITEASSDSAAWLGICQGLAIFPGLSRSALTISAGLLTGLGRKFVVKFSYLMSVPAVAAALTLDMIQSEGSFFPPQQAGFYIGGMFLSFLMGMFLIRFLLRISQTAKLRWFAIYSFLMGAVSLAVNYAGK
ncbi:MAG: undecaprenyl-diphosphate phosphatase [Blautia sp.]|nr:undecaprenyl-diphosphate phosphatase [Blautia sp.]